MAHPMNSYRADKVERSRVAKIAGTANRANGGRVRGSRVNVNVIVAPQGGGKEETPPMPPMPPMPMGPPPAPPMPPVSAPVPPIPPAVAPPPLAGGPVPGLRSDGGRTYARGGAVYEQGKRAGTQVQHTPGKIEAKKGMKK